MQYYVLNSTVTLGYTGLQPGQIVSYTYNDGTSHPLADGVNTFTMPNSDISVSAEVETPAFGGDGTAQSPYTIGAKSTLNLLSINVNSGESYQGKYFILTDDIDMAGSEYVENNRVDYLYTAWENGEFVYNKSCSNGYDYGSIKRLNYFEWIRDFDIPTTNNLSERSLRFAKTKDKISGQFESVNYAKHFADIRTYPGTCAANGINEYTALLRLTRGNPFSLSEILSGAT